MTNDITLLTNQIASATVINPDVVDMLNRLAQLQLDKDAVAACNVASQAVEEARSIGYQSGEAQALIYAGMGMAKQRNYAEALQLYAQSLTVYEVLKDLEGVAVAHAKMGNVQLHNSKYTEALSHYEMAIKIRLELGDELGAADLYSNSGVIYGFQGQYPLALKSHQQALKTFERRNESSKIAISATNVGTIYKELQNYEEALQMYYRALEIRETAKDLKAVSDLLTNIGRVYQEQGKYESALDLHERALRLYEQGNHKDEIAFSSSNLGSIYKSLGKHDIALDFYNRALKFWQELNDKRGLVYSYINLGELFFELNKFQEAHHYLDEAIKLAEETGLKSELRTAFEYLSKLFAIEKNYEMAYNYYQRYTQLDKEISNADTSKQIAQMTVRYEIEQKERDAELEKRKNIELKKAYSSLEDEKKRSEELLLNILPVEVSEELKQFGKTTPRNFEMVTVMFADIQGFTGISEQLTAEEVVSGIDEYFEEFDKIVDKYDIEKIKTIGDAYLCVGGVPVPVDDHAERVVRAAMEFIAASQHLKDKRESENKRAFHFRIGIHSGHVVAGVVGIKKFAYDIWGDTVNTASRMQQNSEPNHINISQTTYDLVKDKFNCTFRGEIEAKSKGLQKLTS